MVRTQIAKSDQEALLYSFGLVVPGSGVVTGGQNRAMGLTGSPVMPWIRGGATVSMKL